MATIELTPELVFERRDGVTTPGSTLWNSTGTTPRASAKPRNQGRGYHSLGSATLPTRGRKGGNNSEYGVMISIKDIKGHPFVVLEDKDKQKHMVQAPDGETSDPALLSPARLNGFTPDAEYDDSILSSSSHPTSSVASGLKREATPSPVPRNLSKGPGRHHGRSKIPASASNRSRSLSPGRAAMERRANRARSVSPPRRERSAKQINKERIRPVTSLIGYFESGSPTPDPSSLPRPSKVKLVGNTGSSRIRAAARKVNAERMASPTSTVSSSISSSVDVSVSSQKSNLTVTTVDSPSKSGNKKPEGRYFAITSPGPMTPKSSFTLPRKTSDPEKKKPQPEYLTLQARKAVFESKPDSRAPALKATIEAKSATKPQAMKQSTFRKSTSPKNVAEKEQVEESPVIPTHVSKAKFIGPSQMLLNKTRRRRKAKKLSIGHSESEYSESEYSDAESLKLGEEAFKDDDEVQDNEKVDNEVSELTLVLNKLPDDEEYKKQLGHKRTPSIKFEKISSEDVTRKDDITMSPSEAEKHRHLVDGLNNDLDKANKRIRELEKEVNELRSKLLATQQELDTKNAENGLLQKEVLLLKKDLEEALSSDEDEKQSAMVLERMLKAARREKSTLEDTITLLESQKTTLKSQLQDARREREDGEVQLRTLRLEIERQKSRAREHEREVEGVRKELARSKRQTDTQIHDMEHQLSKAEKKSHDLQIENSSLEKQLYDLKHEKMASMNEDKLVNDAMTQLEASKLKALQELEEAHAEVDAKARALREADRKNNKLQEELRRMDQEMEEELKERETTLADARQTEQKYRDLVAQSQVANRDIEMLRKELDDAVLRTKEAERRSDNLQNSVDEKESVVNSLEKKNKSLHKQLEEGSLARLQLNQDLHNLDKDNKKLREDISDLKEQLKRKEIELLASQDALNDLRKELQEATDEADEERYKLSEIDNDAQDLKNEYDRVKSDIDQKNLALKNAREAIAKIELQMKEYEETRSKTQKEKLLIETDRDDAKREMVRLQSEVESHSEQMDYANRTIKDLQEKLDSDMKFSESESEKIEELNKEVQRLKQLLDEKSQQVFAAEETIYRQKEVIEEMSSIQQSAEKSALSEMEKFMAETEKQFKDINKQLEQKVDEIKKLEKEKKDLEEDLEELEQQHPHLEDEHEKEEALVNLSQKLQEEEEDKKQILAKYHMTQDKIGNLQNELEIERSRVQILLEDKAKHKEETDHLNTTIEELEDKLEQEAKELSNITSHHLKTEMKLRDVLEQAEDETDKAIREKELLIIRAEELEKQVEEAEIAAQRAEDDKREMEEELQQQLEANYKLQQTLAALGIGHSPSGSDGGKGSLLTSI